MTEEQYKQEIKKIKEEYISKLRLIQDTYVREINNYSIGDIFKDHMGSIEIEVIRTVYCSENNLPNVRFDGIILNKNFTQRKTKDNRRSAFLSNEQN